MRRVALWRFLDPGLVANGVASFRNPANASADSQTSKIMKAVFGLRGDLDEQPARRHAARKFEPCLGVRLDVCTLTDRYEESASGATAPSGSTSRTSGAWPRRRGLVMAAPATRR